MYIVSNSGLISSSAFICGVINQDEVGICDTSKNHFSIVWIKDCYIVSNFGLIPLLGINKKDAILFQLLDRYFWEVWIKVFHCFKIRIKYVWKIIISFLASGNLSSADNHCKQFGPRSGPTECWSWSGSRLLDTLMVFLKEFFEKVNFDKNQQTTAEKREKLPSMPRVNP